MTNMPVFIYNGLQCSEYSRLYLSLIYYSSITETIDKPYWIVIKQEIGLHISKTDIWPIKIQMTAQGSFS